MYCLHLRELQMKDTPPLLNSIKNPCLALENHKINVIKKWNRRYRINRVLTNTYSIRESYILHPNNPTFPCNTTYMWVFLIITMMNHGIYNWISFTGSKDFFLTFPVAAYVNLGQHTTQTQLNLESGHKVKYNCAWCKWNIFNIRF